MEKEKIDIAYKILRSYTHNEDEVQDVMLKLFESFPSFNPELSSWSTWVHNIMKNKNIDNWRKKEIDATPLSYFEVEDSNGRIQNYASNLLSDESNALNDMILSEEKESVLNRLKTLKGNYREVLIKRILEEKTYAEISDDLSLSLSATKTTIKRAIEMLKENKKKEVIVITNVITGQIIQAKTLKEAGVIVSRTHQSISNRLKNGGIIDFKWSIKKEII